MTKEDLDNIKKTREYISVRWPLAVHQPNQEKDARYRLPFPFVPPCIEGGFQELFYWDTFYTNRGMIADGYPEFAKCNVDNLIYALEKLGFVPNAYSENLIKWSSQPPYLHFMVKDIYDAMGDKEWLKKAYFALKKEYEFWMTKRIAKNGLNRHFHNPLPEEDLCDYYKYVAEQRLNLPMDLPATRRAELAENYIADAESGLDFTPRFQDRGIHINPVDLNANLYGLELDLASYAKMFEPEEEARFLMAAKKRKEKMDALMRDEDGVYYDYDFDEERIFRKDYCFTGQFMVFVTGLSTDKDAAKKILSRLSYPFGIVSTQRDDEEKIAYQAAYPYSWPYDNYLAYWGLKSVGLLDEAKAVGETWIKNLANTFAATGKLWETYDPLKGGRAEKKEYPAEQMMGWTAGTFSTICKDFGIEK